MSIRIPLPTDEQLPASARKILGNLPPANVFRMVANAPSSLAGFVQLAGSILLQSELDGRLREIAVLRVAHVTGSRYEWEQHIRIAAQMGVTTAEMALLATDSPVQGLGEKELLVCRAAEEISRDVRLSNEALSALLATFGQRQTTELILCCAYFNMLSRFLESTRVELDADLDRLHAEA